LFSLLKAAVERGDPSFDMSGGEQVRDFMPIEKAVSNFVSLSLQRKNSGVVNICSGQPVSVKNLVDKWLEENHWQIDLHLGVYPYPDYEPMTFWGSTDRLNALLGTRG
jgi:dTDP-6-deoxy-L-talose 4-dehydrogenase (NAD+)